MIEDVEMKDSNAPKEEPKPQPALVNPVYNEYRKCLQNLEKAISLKDTKSLLFSYRQVNKFRKHLSDEDVSYLYDTLLRSTYDCQAVPPSEQSSKV